MHEGQADTRDAGRRLAHGGVLSHAWEARLG